MAIAAMGAIGILPPLALVAGLAWLSHLLVDRALGDGMRTTGADVREAQLVAVRSQAR